MKHIRLTLLLIATLPLTLWADRVACVGTAHQVVQGGDTLFFFLNEVHLSYPRAVNWYRASDGALVQSNTTDIYPDDGSYYVEDAGVRHYVHAFTYTEPTDLVLTLTDVACDRTVLTLSGSIPVITYYTAAGQRTFERDCRLSYTDLMWGEEEWVDSLAVGEARALQVGTYSLPPICKATDICLVYDLFAEPIHALDSVCVTLDAPVAVKIHPTSTTTTRGDVAPAPGSNEKERPDVADFLKGSGPLDILFELHPTPAAQYYSWRIYRGSNQLIVDRTDETTRYTFSEPGAYRVVGMAYNPTCSSDSADITVNVSESFIKVPNVFTPNGDGQNDEFRVAYRSIKEFHCWVYNRWGKLVYDWSDPAKGWDGTINGRPAAEGAYYYVIRALGTDAARGASYTSKGAYQRHQRKDDTMIGVYQLSGDINLVRGK